MLKNKRSLFIVILLSAMAALSYAQSSDGDAGNAVKEYLHYYKLDGKATPQEVERLTALRIKLFAPTSTQADREAVYEELFPILYRLLGTTPVPPEQVYKTAAQNSGRLAHRQLASGPYKPVGQATMPPGQLGPVEKLGRGPVPMILIADVATDWTLYKSFMERNAGRYTMYGVTLPGSGGSPLPPAPEFYAPGATPLWDNAVQGIVKLIEKNKLDKPVIVGAKASAYAAARIAIDHPDKVRAAVLLDAVINVPYRSLVNPQVPATMEERLNLLATRPSPMGMIGDFGPRVTLSRESIEQMIKSAPEPQRQIMLYNNVRDPERGRALFINGMLNTDPWSFHYNVELNGTDLTGGLKNLKTPLLSIVALPDDNSSAQGGQQASQWQAVKLRYPTIPVAVARFENTRSYIVEEAPQELDKAIEAFLAGKPVEGTKGNVLAARPSPRASASQVIGATEVNVAYGRPAVNNRQVWGQLVPYNRVWRTGANEATAITFGTDVLVEGQRLAAGSYNFFTIPTENEWTIIFSKVTDQWGHFYYDPEFDALQAKVKPQPAEHQEWLSYSFDVTSPSSAQMVIRWEKVKVPVKIEAETAKNP